MAECRDSTINNTNTQKQITVIGYNDPYEENKTDKVMEPLLIEDLETDKVPRSFEKICTYMQNNGILLDTNDYIFLLIHVLMLECGFVTSTCEEYLNSGQSGYNLSRILNCVNKIDSNWKKSETVRSGCYILPPFVKYSCSITCTECADDIIVNGVVQNIDCDNLSLLIDPSRYIISSTTKMANRFQDIAHLSRMFKSSVAISLKNAIMIHNNVPALRLEDLPVEVLHHIRRFLDLQSSGRLNMTSRYFRVLGCYDRVRRAPRRDVGINFQFMPLGYWTTYNYNRRLD